MSTVNSNPIGMNWAWVSCARLHKPGTWTLHHFSQLRIVDMYKLFTLFTLRAFLLAGDNVSCD